MIYGVTGQVNIEIHSSSEYISPLMKNTDATSYDWYTGYDPELLY